MRILLFLLLIYLLYQLFKPSFFAKKFSAKKPSKKTPKKRAEIEAHPMVQCVTCETFVPTKESIRHQGHSFCSEKCRDAY